MLRRWKQWRYNRELRKRAKLRKLTEEWVARDRWRREQGCGHTHWWMW